MKLYYILDSMASGQTTHDIRVYTKFGYRYNNTCNAHPGAIYQRSHNWS